MMRVTAMLRALAIATLVAGVGACGGDSTDPGSEDLVAGEYVLQTVNGEELPAAAVTWQDPSGSWQAVIQSGTLKLEQGTYEASFVVDFVLDSSIVSRDDVEVITTGTYAASGTRVTLKSADPRHGSTEGTLEGDVLTVSQPIENYGTFTATYHRERPN